jgi:DNA-binding CsgD family transcriptional regulator
MDETKGNHLSTGAQKLAGTDNGNGKDEGPVICPNCGEEVICPHCRGTGLNNSPQRELPPREKEVLGHLADGLNTVEIAELMGLSRKTVETYKHRMKLRLNLRSLSDLLKYAIREGYTSLESRQEQHLERL